MIKFNTKKKHAERKAEARRIIKAIAKIMDAPYNPADPACDLWMVLSALRGPDSENNVVKNFTTTRIRAVIGMKPGMSNAAGVTVDPLVPVSLTSATNNHPELVGESSHFNFHFLSAASALQKLGFLKKDKS